MNARTKKRRRAEVMRAYGPPERRRWVSQLNSVVSGRTPCVNAHTRNGGVSRKSDACWIVPLTWQEHAELHRIGQETFEAKYEIDLHAEAEKIEQRWQAHQKGEPDLGF